MSCSLQAAWTDCVHRASDGLHLLELLRTVRHSFFLYHDEIGACFRLWLGVISGDETLPLSSLVVFAGLCFKKASGEWFLGSDVPVAVEADTFIYSLVCA